MAQPGAPRLTPRPARPPGPLRVDLACLLVLLGWVLVVLTACAWAARPLDTEDPGTVPQGKGEFQGNVDAARGNDGALVGLRGALGLGLLPTLDIRVQTALLWVDPQDEPSRAFRKSLIS